MIRAITSVIELDDIFPEEKALLTGFVYTPFLGNTSKLHAVDRAGNYIVIEDVPEAARDEAISRGGIEIFIRKIIYNYHQYMSEVVIYKYYTPHRKKCDCGAKVSFLPHIHSQWCSSQELL